MSINQHSETTPLDFTDIQIGWRFFLRRNGDPAEVSFGTFMSEPQVASSVDVDNPYVRHTVSVLWDGSDVPVTVFLYELGLEPNPDTRELDHSVIATLDPHQPIRGEN